MNVVRRARVARRDLVEIYQHLARDRSPATARRFLKHAEETFRRLASIPGVGARYAPADPAFSDLRVAPVSRFKRFLVFYRPATAGIEVLRGARDIDAIFGDTLGPAGEDETGDD